MSLKRLLPLVILLAVSITIMTYQGGRKIIAPFSFLINPLNKLNGVFNALSASVKEPFRKIILRDDDNKRLKEEVNSLLLERQKYSSLIFENQRLREILALKEKERRYITTASVISKGWDRWSNSVIISKGRQSGIVKDMIVITPRGLVGKITSATDDTANVMFLTDVNFSAAVKIQDTRKDAIVSGTGSSLCFLKYLTQDETIKKGSVIVTSGFDELFPSGIPVGYTIPESTKGDGDEVVPFQDVSKLDEVIIISR